jgi:hypothetical protein
MKLFIVHTGYYDNEIGIYELHTNFIVAANDIREVKNVMQKKEIFVAKNMHIDAIQEIEIINGYKVELVRHEENITKLNNYNYQQIKNLSYL